MVLSDEPSDRLTTPRAQRISTAVAVAGLILSLVVYVWFIHQYAVNMIWQDQWSDVHLIGRMYSGRLDVSTLWAQHTENRIFFPNLVVLMLARFTHFNVLIEDYISALMLLMATGLFVLSHRRRSKYTPWILYLPVAVVMLSFVQGNDSLWGFAMSWYLVMLALAFALFWLDSPSRTVPHLAAAMAAGVVGTFSSIEGLLIWPAGLVILACRRQFRFLVAWISVALISSGIYFYHFDFQAAYLGGSRSYAFHHPLKTIEYLLGAVGVTNDVMGILVMAILIAIVSVYAIKRPVDGAFPIGFALITFGTLFAVVTTIGRTALPVSFRYATFDVLVLVGCYLAMLDRSILGSPTVRHHRVGRPIYADGPLERLVGLPTATSAGRALSDTALLGVRALLVGVVCMTLLFGIGSGLPAARSWHATEVRAVRTSLNIDSVSDRDVIRSLLPAHSSTYAPWVRRMADIARKHRLSLFELSNAGNSANPTK